MLKLLSLFLLVGSSNVWADAKSLEEFYTFYKKGQYDKAIDSLEKLSNEQNSAASKNYLTAISYSRLQQFDKANEFFNKAIEANSEAKDIYYEYGQALYATNDLKKSRDMFMKSAQNDYNYATSLYYVAHISQILEDYAYAETNYLKVIKSKGIDTRLEQVSKFQLAETRLSLLRTAPNKDKEILSQEVSKKILPVFKQAYEVDKSTPVSLDIDKRIKEIQKEYDLDPDVMRNGRRISSKRFYAYLDLKTKFDDNVSNTNLENDVQQSHKESFVSEFEAETKYNYVFRKRLITTPLFRFNFNQYSNQDEADVYKNDSMIFTAALKNKYEALVRGNPSSIIFDIDYSKTFKDYESAHTRKAFSKAFTFTLGEQFTFTDRGDTTIKIKRKSFSGYTDTLNNYTTTFSVDQTLAMPNNQLLIILFNLDMVDNYNSPSTNSNSYMFRFDYLFPEILPKIMITTSFAYTITDNLEQTTRGFESTFNPSVEIAKDITKNVKGLINIDYSKNQSKSDDYKYSKFVTNLEFKYSF